MITPRRIPREVHEEARGQGRDAEELERIRASWEKAEASYAEVLNLEAGTRLREPYGNRRLWHLRGIIDDRLVLRTWDRSRQGWHYAVEGFEWWTVWSDRLEIARPKKRRGRGKSESLATVSPVAEELERIANDLERAGVQRLPALVREEAARLEAEREKPLR